MPKLFATPRPSENTPKKKNRWIWELIKRRIWFLTNFVFFLEPHPPSSYYWFTCRNKLVVQAACLVNMQGNTSGEINNNIIECSDNRIAHPFDCKMSKKSSLSKSRRSGGGNTTNVSQDFTTSDQYFSMLEGDSRTMLGLTFPRREQAQWTTKHNTATANTICAVRASIPGSVNLSMIKQFCSHSEGIQLSSVQLCKATHRSVHPKSAILLQSGWMKMRDELPSGGRNAISKPS